MERIVELDRVGASYEGEAVPTLYDVDLCVGAGERIAIIGPNGAGKTTLLEVVNGLLPATSGAVRVFGESMRDHGHRLRTRIAYVPQSLFFAPETPFLVRDVVIAARFALLGRIRWPGRRDRAAVGEALAAVRAVDLGGRPIGRLSGGQQRKVLLARAVAQGAELLLLDEPTANLDPEAKDEVARLVRQIEREMIATSLLVSHEGGPLIDGADRLLRIETGRITHDGPVAEVRAALSGVGSR